MHSDWLKLVAWFATDHHNDLVQSRAALTMMLFSNEPSFCVHVKVT